jgi:hypothetical protein
VRFAQSAGSEHRDDESVGRAFHVPECASAFRGMLKTLRETVSEHVRDAPS